MKKIRRKHNYQCMCIIVIIGVHERHGQMHPNCCQITVLLVVDLCSSLAYFMIT